MGSRLTIGIVLIVVGVIVLILSLVADVIGIGNPSVFGPLQIGGAIVGAVATVVGLVLWLKK